MGRCQPIRTIWWSGRFGKRRGIRIKVRIEIAGFSQRSVYSKCAALGRLIVVRMSEATFIGIDLAWRGRNPSGGCVLTGDRRRARLVNVDASLASCSAVLTYIDNHAAASTYVAIDAPLIIRNETGQRPCETLIGKRYGARHASCHSSNLLLYPNALGVDLASQLISRGYKHALDGTRTENERVILE